MKIFKVNKLFWLLLLGLGLGMLLSGCSNDLLNNDIVYRFSGSIGVGDFVEVEINLTDQNYAFTNRITNEQGAGSFQAVNNNFYEITGGELAGNYFTILNDEILLVSVKEAEEGQRLIAALKSATGPYGSEIAGTYNVATSLEGWIGVVTIDADSSTVEVKLDLNGDGFYTEAEDEMLTMSYSFDENFQAIKIIEDEEFKHYGVFLNNDVGIFDSYMWDGSSWVGDGMFILVKQSNSVTLADYAGEYTYIDVDADYGTFELLEEGNVLKFLADGEETGISFSQADIHNGVISIEADLLGEGSEQQWNFVFLPGQVIIVASADDVSFGGIGDDGGLAIGVKTD